MVVAMVSQVVVRLLLPAVVYQTITMVFCVIGIVLQGGSTLLRVSARWLLCFIRYPTWLLGCCYILLG